MEQQRTLKIGDRVLYCYEDGSVEFLSQADQNAKHPLVRTFGTDDGNGYKFIGINLNDKRKTLRVHRLIALAFHPNPNNLPEVDHINRDRADNRPCNLRWVSREENITNQDRVDRSIAKYGVRRCEDKKKYNELHNKDYNTSHISLRAIQPNGKRTCYYFSSESDPVYVALKPLSMVDRYYKYISLKKNKSVVHELALRASPE